MTKTYATISTEITNFSDNHARARTASEVRTIAQDILDYPKDSAPASHTHLWADITDKPTTFAPAAHTHTKSEITDWAHTHVWADITDKPTTFAPSSHSHGINEITDLGAQLSAISLQRGWVSIIADVAVVDTTHFTLPHAVMYDNLIGLNAPVKIENESSNSYCIITAITDIGASNSYTISGALLNPMATPEDIFIGNREKVISEKFTIPQGAFASASADEFALINQWLELYVWNKPASYPVMMTAFCKTKDSSAYNPLINFKRIRMSDVTFSGTGLDDMIYKGIFSGNQISSNSYCNYEIEIVTATSFKWRHEEQHGNWSANIDIVEDVWISLNDGIAIMFTGGMALRVAGDRHTFFPTPQAIFADGSDLGIEISDIINYNDTAQFVENFSLEPNDRLEITIDQNSANGDCEDATLELIYIVD